MRTLDEFACSSVGGGAQDPKVTLAGAGMILGALEVGKAVVAAGVTVVSVTGAGVAVTVGPVAAGGGRDWSASPSHARSWPPSRSHPGTCPST